MPYPVCPATRMSSPFPRGSQHTAGRAACGRPALRRAGGARVQAQAGQLVQHFCTAIWASRRARWAPRQKCGPWAKARCCAASGRRMSKTSGSPKTAGSRFAPAMDTVTWSPARIRACRAGRRGSRSGRRRPRQAPAAAIPRSPRGSGRRPRAPVRARRGGQQVQHGVGDHALGGLDPAETPRRPRWARGSPGRRSTASVSGPAASASSSAARGAPAAMTCPRLAASAANAASAAVGSGLSGGPGTAAARARGCGLGLDGGHDPVVPGQDLRGVGLPEAERLGHDRDGQRARHRAAELGLASRPDGDTSRRPRPG